MSDGSNGTEHDLYMTYSFEWRRPEVTEGSEEHTKLAEEYRKGARNAVHASIEAMRKMATAGGLD